MEIKSIAEQLLYTVVRIETFYPDGSQGTGTGFIFQYTLQDVGYVFLVTNKHVVANAQRGSLIFTQAQDGKAIMGTGYRLDIAQFSDMWTGHPSPEVDVAIAPFVPLVQHIQEQGITIFFRSIDSTLIPPADVLDSLDALEEIVFVGYPNGIWDNTNLLPIFRKGTTATPVMVDFQGQKQFLIDASVFPGSSGSPVFLYNSGAYTNKNGGTAIGTRILFLGIVASVFFLQEVNQIQMVTLPTANIPVAMSRQMIDLGLVFKASTILEVIELFLRNNGVQI